MRRIKARIDGMVMENPVLLFSISACASCIRAKAVLQSAKYTVLELDCEPDGLTICDYLQEIDNKSVPAIWIGGQYIGGYDTGGPTGGGIKSLQERGELLPMLKRVGAVIEITKEYLVRRMQQGVILKTSRDNNLSDDGGTFADFGTDDPIQIASCAICQVDYEQGDRVVTSDCKHVFHTDCLSQWVILNTECPCCRKVFVDPEAASLRPALALDGDV